jgi:hypothetical protein
MALPKPFGDYIRTQKKYDAVIMRILEQAAIAIESRLKRLGTTGFSASIRAAQLRLALAEIRLDQRDMWLSLGDVIRAGQIEAALIAVDDMDRINRVLYASLPDDAAKMLAASVRETARSGIKSLYARKPIAISQKVMIVPSTAVADAIEEIIQSSLAAGLSAKEFAQTVRSYISPRTPGGASYAASRIARTEINNAFHERQIAQMDSPGVLAAKWNLSGSHRKPDDCNKFAETDQYDMGAGIFPRGKVPKKPHPHCLCYLTMVTMSPEEFVAGLRSGKFDDELRKRFNTNRQLLGLEPTTAAKPARALKSVPNKPAVPVHAKPFHRDLDGIEDLSSAVENGFPPKTRTRFTAGASAETELLELRNGKKVVQKTTSSTEAGAEQVASKYGRAVGLKPPRVYRTEPGSVYMDYISDSKTSSEFRALASAGSEADRVAWGKRFDTALNSDDGKRVGLLDVMINNNDRNPGNWMLSGHGRITPIDHGFAAPGIDPRGAVRVRIHSSSPFAEKHLLENGRWKDNDFTPDDIEEVRRRLLDLQPDLDHIGEGDKWLRYANAVLDKVAAKAKGTRNLIKGVE